jgi:hypothetical protein
MYLYWSVIGMAEGAPEAPPQSLAQLKATVVPAGVLEEVSRVQSLPLSQDLLAGKRFIGYGRRVIPGLGVRVLLQTIA